MIMCHELVHSDKKGQSRILKVLEYYPGSHITLQPKTGCPLKLSSVESGQYLDGRPPGKTRLLLEEVLVRPAGCLPCGLCGS